MITKKIKIGVKKLLVNDQTMENVICPIMTRGTDIMGCYSSRCAFYYEEESGGAFYARCGLSNERIGAIISRNQ